MGHGRRFLDVRFDGVDRHLDGMDGRLNGIEAELKDIHRRLDAVEEAAMNFSGFAKEIDHLLSRVVAIEKQLGLSKKMAARLTIPGFHVAK